MTGRPTAGATTSELVAALRVDGYVYAADRLTELDAENQRLRESSRGMSRHIVRKGFENQELDALLPPCPTCGGKGYVSGDFTTPYPHHKPCPDCIDGKVSIEKVVAERVALWSDGLMMDAHVVGTFLRGDAGDAMADGGRKVIAYLRSVKP